MNYLFLGSGNIARKCLEQALTAGEKINRPVAVIADNGCLSLPDLPCSIERIEVNTLDKREDVIRSVLLNLKPEFLVSVQYPWILSSSILGLLPRGAFNIHNAKLPTYRGHNSLSYEILNGDKTHTSTLHLMDAVVDRGYFVKCEEIEIKEDDTAFSLWERSSESCISLFRWLVFLENYRNVNDFRKPIEGVGRYYAKHDIQVAKRVPKDADSETLMRYARAFHFPPHEPAYVSVGNRKIHLIWNWIGADGHARND